WILRQGLQDTERRSLAQNAIEGLSAGLGRASDDSVFLRSYSTLVLCAIVERDLIHPFLRSVEYRRILSSALRLLDREKDLRGFVPGKGWAHTLAHLADLFDSLVKSPHLQDQDLQRILKSIAKRLLRPTSTVLGYGEPVRLAKAVITLLNREIVPIPYINSWIDSLSQSSKGRRWSEVDDNPGDVRARTNVTLFLSALVILTRVKGAHKSKARAAQFALKALRQISEG
ncbi:hypothetical protein B2A_08205, partial [mine drainage metagenome]